MEFPKSSRVEKCLSKDPTQRILENPFLMIYEDGTAEVLASSGRNGVVIPVQVGPDDVTGPVPIEALKELRKSGGVLKCTAEYAILPSGAAFPRATAQFPKYPALKSLLVSADDAVVEVAVNAKALFELAQAMGTETVRLRVQGPTLAVGVEPHGSEPHIEGARAALLPYVTARV